MNKTLFVFATELEAEATRKRLSSQLSSSGISIVICGMGPQKAYNTLLPYMKEAKAIYNFGIAGALKKDLPVGTIYQIAKASTKSTSLVLAKDGATLFTVEKPLHDETVRDELSIEHDLVDMEGASIAALAYKYKMPCHLFKMVSDYCNKNTSQDIKKSLPLLSDALATYISCKMSEMIKVTATGTFT